MTAKITKIGDITQKWVKLLAPFTGDYSAKLSVSELSRRAKIPQQSASRYLNSLARLNLIDYKREGKNKMFYFDLKKPATKIIFSLAENQKALTFQLTPAAAIINEILEFCESLVVFGSYASGKNLRESDLDIVVLGKHNREKIKKIKPKQVVEINEHYISYREFRKKIKEKNPLALEIMHSHILFGNVSRLIDIFLEAKK